MEPRPSGATTIVPEGCQEEEVSRRTSQLGWRYCSCGRCEQKRSLFARKHSPAPVHVSSVVTKRGAALGRRFAPGWLRIAVLKRDRYRCRYCNVSVTDKTANMDHVTPWPFGMTEYNNLRTACRECNRKKGRKTLDQMHKKRPRKWGPSAWKGMRDYAPEEDGPVKVRRLKP